MADDTSLLPCATPICESKDLMLAKHCVRPCRSIFVSGDWCCMVGMPAGIALLLALSVVNSVPRNMGTFTLLFLLLSPKPWANKEKQKTKKKPHAKLNQHKPYMSHSSLFNARCWIYSVAFLPAVCWYKQELQALGAFICFFDLIYSAYIYCCLGLLVLCQDSVWNVTELLLFSLFKIASERQFICISPSHLLSLNEIKSPFSLPSPLLSWPVEASWAPLTIISFLKTWIIFAALWCNFLVLQMFSAN